MVDNRMIVDNLRHMAWERAKGELRSMTHTFWEERDSENYRALNNVISEFIKRVEDGELYE